MNKLFLTFIFSLILLSCSQFNKGIIAKKELRKKKPQSVQIAEEYDRQAKKGPKAKTYNNPEKKEKARNKRTKKHKKKANKYLKKKRKKLK